MRIAVVIDLASPFRQYLDVHSGIMDYASPKGWECVSDPFFDPKRLPVDGIVGRVTRRLLDAASRAQIPIVNVHHNAPIALHRMTTVVPDYAQAGQMAAKHLLARGYQSFAVAGYRNNRSQDEMDLGFLEALGGCGHKPTTRLEVCWNPERDRSSWLRYQKDVDAWLESLPIPIAIFANRDLLAHQLIKRCRQMGLRIPSDVGIVCTESCPYLCNHEQPTVSAVELGFRSVGHRAAQILAQMIAGESPSSIVRVAPKGVLCRQTTCFMVPANPLVARAMRFIQDRYVEPIGVNEIARAVCVSRRTLERQVRESMNATVTDLLTAVRMHKAKQLLIDSDLLLKEVAFASGFRDSNRLNCAFRRLEGCLPRQYREQWHRRRPDDAPAALGDFPA